MQISKIEFLKSDLFMNSWAAAVQHNKVYSIAATDKKKDEFIQKIEVYINLITKMYKNKITEEEHINNISKIKEYIDINFKDILNNSRINVGTVQKLFNLLLKYYWSCGFIKEPPHCPVDRIILQYIKINDVNWTKIETIENYKEVIERIKKNTNGVTLSKWELSVWKRRRITKAST